MNTDEQQEMVTSTITLLNNIYRQTTELTGILLPTALTTTNRLYWKAGDFRIPAHDCVTWNACSRSRVVIIKFKKNIFYGSMKVSSGKEKGYQMSLELVLPQSHSGKKEY